MHLPRYGRQVADKTFELTTAQKEKLSEAVTYAIQTFSGNISQFGLKVGVCPGTILKWENKEIRFLRLSGGRCALPGLNLIAKMLKFKSWVELFDSAIESKTPKLLRKKTTVLGRPAEDLHLRRKAVEDVVVAPTIEPAVVRNRIDPHKLLLAMVTSGMPGGTALHKIECDNHHLVGYAKVPQGAAPQSIAIHCLECSEIAAIGGLLTPEEPPKKTPQEPKTPEPTVNIYNSGSDKKETSNASKKSMADVVRQRQKTRDDNLATELERCQAAIMAEWEQFDPLHPAKTLEALLKDRPYRSRAYLPYDVIFQACWLAKRCWNEKFVEQLAKLWGCTEKSLRQRVETMWAVLHGDLQKKMPFMVEATLQPQQWKDKLTKSEPPTVSAPAPDVLVKETPTEGQPANLRVVGRTPDPHDWRSQQKIANRKRTY